MIDNFFLYSAIISTGLMSIPKTRYPTLTNDTTNWDGSTPRTRREAQSRRQTLRDLHPIIGVNAEMGSRNGV